MIHHWDNVIYHVNVVIVVVASMVGVITTVEGIGDVEM
jgi:hypothetical protein